MKEFRPFAPLVFLAVSAFACVPRGPEQALAAYREAIARRDASAIHAMSDASFRAAFDEEAVRSELEANGARELGEVSTAEEHASFVLESGETIDFILEDGTWKVAGGGISPARFDTPERALETFFRAALAGKLDLVRAAIPKRFRDQLATDDALTKHIASMSDRLTRARTRIGPITRGRAVIHGAQADLTYGPGWSVTFEKEDDRWVIVDLE